MLAITLCAASSLPHGKSYTVCHEKVDGTDIGTIDNIFELKSGDVLAESGSGEGPTRWARFSQKTDTATSAGQTDPNFITQFGDLPDGGALIDGNYGLLQYDPRTIKVSSANGAPKLFVDTDQFAVDDGSYLLYESGNFFRFNVSKNILEPLSQQPFLNDVFNQVLNTISLPNGRLLLITNDGIVIYDPANGKFRAFGPQNAGWIASSTRLPDGRWLVEYQHASYIIDTLAMTAKPAGFSVCLMIDLPPLCQSRIRPASDGNMFLAYDGGLAFFDEKTSNVRFIGKEINFNFLSVYVPISRSKGVIFDSKSYVFNIDSNQLSMFGHTDFGLVFDAHYIDNKFIFVNAQSGLYILNSADGNVLQEIPPVDTTVTERLADGGFLAMSGAGDFWRVDPKSGRLLSAGHTKRFDQSDDAPIDGGVLVMSPEGEYFYNPATKMVASAGTTAVGHIYVRETLAGGGLLIGAENGLFLFDPTTNHMSSVSAFIGMATSEQTLSNGDFLFGTDEGLIRLWLETTARPCPVNRLERIMNRISSWW